MPTKPLKPCSHPGCPTLMQNGGYCDKHKKINRDYDLQRGTAAKRGYDSRWQKYRKWFLSRNPLCVECLKNNELIPATNVDHIQEVKGQSDPLFWEPTNHQALCHSCHSKKTVRENGGFGR